MLNSRVIPCLLLQNEGLIKTLKFAKPKYIGDPINAIRIFNDKEVDELIVLDIDASKDERDPNFTLIEKFASECFMPLCYGGGIRSVQQAQQLFALGIEKICLNVMRLSAVGRRKRRFSPWLPSEPGCSPCSKVNLSAGMK